MKKRRRYLFTSILVLLFFLQQIPKANSCGPVEISPIFDVTTAPEEPFQNFASGQLGIVKPTHRRVVLFAAYRYLTGGGFNFDEQKELLRVWNAQFKNRDLVDEDITAEVKKWIEQRKTVVGNEEKIPEIYTERSFGGYEFFPNCAKNAFETATQTLGDRINSYGSNDPEVLNWVRAQDQVFTNCSTGRMIPQEAAQTSPMWLQKDRAYQIAAAEFYSLNYDEAQKRFSQISEDFESPWQETAHYLVGRTLIRKAGALKDENQKKLALNQAEQILTEISGSGGRFSDSAEGLLGYVKYRLHPKERVSELAQSLTFQTGGNHLGQDLIDYSWLLDKFEKQSLEAEEARKKEKTGEPAANTSEKIIENPLGPDEENPDKLKITFYNEDYSQYWTILVPLDATDDEAISEAERVAGGLTDKMKERIRQTRQNQYAQRFSQTRQDEYEGGYWGEEETTLSMLPQFLRTNDLTDWLFTYQIQGPEAYLYSLEKFKQNRTDLWLMTAISKADRSSSEINFLLEAAARTSPNSPAYPTIAFHRSRILIEQGKMVEARKSIDEVLNAPVNLPQSAQNQFFELRKKLAGDLDEFLKFSLLKPYAFNWDGQNGSIDDFIKQIKSYFNPENGEQTRDQFEREVEEQYKDTRLWQDRWLFDYDTTETMNLYFSLDLLNKSEKSPALPDYLRERFALAVWTRAILFNDLETAKKIEPEVLKFQPGWRELFQEIDKAPTTEEKQNAALFIILKNPVLTPFVSEGLGKTDNEFNSFDINDWWCAPYVSEDGEERQTTPPPAFLSKDQLTAAKNERGKLSELGDAPTFLGERALAWAKKSPRDKRVPEGLYIAFEANGWTKYGCGNNSDLRNLIGKYLLKNYPGNEWTRKVQLDKQ
ncbi:MAG: hypothetical protein R2747_04475 [Pyrinomonadaceae bacterium]